MKDLKSAVDDLRNLLDSFEKKNKKVTPSQTRKQQTDYSWENKVPLLAGSNFDAICGETTPVCIIGAFRSSRSKEKLESLLKAVSFKIYFRFYMLCILLAWSRKLLT